MFGLSPTLPACLRCRTLIVTCLLCGCVRADCAALCCACGTAIPWMLSVCLLALSHCDRHV